jgi:glycosyltransferase involved in cell wall biosynthesis
MKPLSILLDARKLGDGGIGTHIENLVEGLIAEKTQGFPLRLSLIIQPGTESAFLERYAADIKLIEDDAKKYSLDEHFGLSRRLKAIIRENDVFHSPHYTLPRGVRIPSVVTIHDTIHLMAPDKFSQRVFAGLLMRSAMKRADQVLTVSGVSLARLGRVVPGVPVTVIQNALASGIGPVSFDVVGQVLSKFSIPQPYIIFVGSDRPHKGFELLVEGLAVLTSFTPTLVAVGDSYSKRTVERTVARLGKNRTRFLSGITRDELVALYNGARAAVVPSRLEGFGLVALEALACGAPLVCTPEISLKEVAGNCAWYAQGFTAGDISEALKSCFSNREISDEKAAAGVQRAAEFSIARCAEAHIQIYLSLLPDFRARELIGATLRNDEPLSYTREALGVSAEGWTQTTTLPEFPSSIDRSLPL